MRVLEPADGVLAFYDGRAEGAGTEGANWVEFDLALGIASYAVVSGPSALVYDTHTSPDRGEFVRAELKRRGVAEPTVVLSHWHLDHIAGAGAFADCEVIATTRTARHLERNREAIERGESSGPPAIDPVVMPTRTFDERMEVEIGERTARLIHFDIHSDDAAVLFLPDAGVLLAGDTLEDTVTYVDDPAALPTHLAELERLAELGAERILPAHGDPDVIAGGGYGPGFISATQSYIRRLIESRQSQDVRELPLRDFVAGDLAAGNLVFHAPYEAVHRQNLERVLAS